MTYAFGTEYFVLRFLSLPAAPVSDELLEKCGMSQILQEESATEQYKVPKLLFAQDTRFDGQQKLYIVVALSQKKQSQIMETVGQVHCQNQPFHTWDLLGQALSMAFFAEPGRLRLKSMMELHQKDYLLFEQGFDGGSVNTSGTSTITESILEVDFGKQSDLLTWQGYWKMARPVVVRLVQSSLENLAQLGENDHRQPDLGNQLGVSKVQEKTDEKT